MNTSSASLTISLGGYRNLYKSPNPSHEDDRAFETDRDTQDWPTHCAFFDKDSNFDVGPFLKCPCDKDMLNAPSNIIQPTYKDFLRLLSGSPENPPKLNSVNTTDVMVEIGFGDGFNENENYPFSIPLQHKISTREVIGKRLSEHSSSYTKATADSGDWSKEVDILGQLSKEDTTIEIISPRDVDWDVKRNQNRRSIFGALRKQLSNLFIREERCHTEKEFYV